MNEEQLNDEKKFRQMLGCVKEIPIDVMHDWLGEFASQFDFTRVESLASALAYDDILFGMSYDTDCPENWLFDPPEDNSGVILVTHWPHLEITTDTGYKRVEKIKEYLIDILPGYLEFIISADSLLKWLNNNYPLEDQPPAPPNSMPFMSDRLKLAVEISAKVYPDGWEKGDRAAYSDEKRKIEAALKDAGIKKDKDGIHSWMSKIINPGEY